MPSGHMERQYHDGTLYSANIEKHAKPNSVPVFNALFTDPYIKPGKIADIFDKNFFHPGLESVPINTLDENMKNVLDFFVEEKLLRKDNFNYYKDKVGFPRVLIRLKTSDSVVYPFAKLRNPDHYRVFDLFTQYLNKYRPQYRHIIDNFHTINNVPVSDIKDDVPLKTLFERVLGNPNDYYNNAMAWGKSKQTLFAAAKRQIKIAPAPDSKVASDFITYAKDVVEREIGDDLTHFGYSYNDWFNHLPAKKQKLIDKVQKYLFDNAAHLDLSTKEIQEILSLNYEAICKTEIQALDGKPRMVCSIPQLIKFCMGPVTWMLEEICAKKFNGYCGGQNLTQMAEKINKYIDQGFTKVVEGDGSAFDNSQDVTLKALDRYIYNRISDSIYHVPKEIFKKIANLHYKNMDVKYTENKHKKTLFSYSVLGSVFSGDCDTTLANTLRMALYNRYTNDKIGLKYGIDYIVFSKGDDFSVMYKEYVPDDLIRRAYGTYFLAKPKGDEEMQDLRIGGLGQICKFLEFGPPNSFKFCSLRSWYIDENTRHITLTRDPSKLYNLSQYSIKSKSYNTQQYAQYHYDLALSYKVNYAGIDIFEMMEKAHTIKARSYAALHPDHNFRTQITLLKQDNKREHRDRPLEDFLKPEIHDLYYNVRHRDKIINIVDDYWSTMQRIEKDRSQEQLTQDQLKLVNQQINNEFDLHELASMLALE